MDNSDLIIQFCNITSAEPAQAESYLQVSDYNVERAIELFFETGGMELAASAPTNPPPPPPPVVPRTATPQNLIDVDDFDDMIDASAPEHNIEDDEALARRLMQEDIDEAGPSEHANNDGVRSPIAARNDILVHPDMDYHQPYMYPSRGRGSSSRGIFNQATPSIWNANDPSRSLADATGGSSQASEKANRLAQMYRRPFEIMHRVTLEEARDTVRSEEPMKWIMVNIMNSQEFSCQILNRDLWSDKEVQRTIRENFYFLQYTQDEPEGLRYERTYPFEQHPHIGIIDPRTGEQVKAWNKIIQPAEFISEIHEFLERYSLNEQARNPVIKKAKIKKDFDMMSEEEQMEAALAASLGHSISAISPPPSRPSTAQGTSQPNPSIPTASDEQTIPVEASPTVEKSSSLFSSILPSDTAEPPQSPQTTRIQFRFPEGGRPLVRRFNKTDTIKDVFAFVKGLRGDDGEFELVFVGRRLLAEAEESDGNSLDRSIVEAGLANGSLTVEV